MFSKVSDRRTDRQTDRQTQSDSNLYSLSSELRSFIVIIFPRVYVDEVVLPIFGLKIFLSVFQTYMITNLKPQLNIEV